MPSDWALTVVISQLPAIEFFKTFIKPVLPALIKAKLSCKVFIANYTCCTKPIKKS